MATRFSRFTAPAADWQPATSSTLTPRFRCGTTRRVPARSSTPWRGHPATKTTGSKGGKGSRGGKGLERSAHSASALRRPLFLYLLNLIYFLYLILKCEELSSAASPSCYAG